MSNGAETTKQRFPQELLISLLKEGKQSLVDILFEQGYTLETTPGPEGSNYGDVVADLTRGTSKDRTSVGVGPFRDADFPVGVYSPEYVDAHWAVDNLINMVEDERIIASISNQSPAPYGEYFWTPEMRGGEEQPQEAVVYKQSEDMGAEHYLNTLIHEAFLHGTGGGHVKHGVTWQGWQPKYEGLSEDFIKSLEGTSALEEAQAQLKTMLGGF